MWIRDHFQRLINSDQVKLFRFHEHKDSNGVSKGWSVAVRLDAVPDNKAWMPLLTEVMDWQEARLRMDAIEKGLQDGTVFLKLE